MGLFILSAVSGTGKSTIARALVNRGARWRTSISHTTRAPRGTEVDGVEYHFRSQDEFEAMIERGEFVEWAQYVEQYYGTSVANVDAAMRDEADLLFDIEINGAQQIKAAYPDAHAIFILPPTFDVLKKRLLNRATDDLDKVYRRLWRGLDELESAESFDYLVVNGELETALSYIEFIRDGKAFDVPNSLPLLAEVRREMRQFLESHSTIERDE